MPLVRLILLTTTCCIRTCSIGDFWEERWLWWLIGVAGMGVARRSHAHAQCIAVHGLSWQVLGLLVQFLLRISHLVGPVGMVRDLYWVHRYLELQRGLLILVGGFRLFLGDSLVWVLRHLVR